MGEKKVARVMAQWTLHGRIKGVTAWYRCVEIVGTCKSRAIARHDTYVQRDTVFGPHVGKREKPTDIHCTAKCRYLKILTCKGTFRQVFYLSEAPPLHTPPFTHCMRVYSILIHTGKGGGGANQRDA